MLCSTCQANTCDHCGKIIESGTEIPKNGIIASLLKEGQYDWVNSDITDKNFPATAEPSLDGARLEAYGRNVSSEFVLADLKAKGRRAANAAETILYGIKNPEEQREHWIVGLGQAWLSPGYGDVVVVLSEGSVGGRRASLYLVAGGWVASRVFLSFPL